MASPCFLVRCDYLRGGVALALECIWPRLSWPLVSTKEGARGTTGKGQSRVNIDSTLKGAQTKATYMFIKGLQPAVGAQTL